ncbi:MAG: energy transducer TonB [Candidatus Krumholzibacteriia bacterium]
MPTLPANQRLDRPPIRMSANDEFKAKYPKYLRWSALTAVVLTIIFFLISPNYEPNPYRLRQEELEIVNMDEQEVIELPPPPQEAPPPPKVIEAAPDEEVTDDVEIADTLIDLDTAISSTMQTYDMSGDEGFVASQENPRLLNWVPPEYPEIARMSQLEGTVVVKVLVGPDGRVLDAAIVQGVHPLLNKAAVTAARRATFIPGKQRNIPVKAWMAIPYRFRLH